jgi:RimJ/RimL family protein N-acetyltransferase
MPERARHVLSFPYSIRCRDEEYIALIQPEQPPREAEMTTLDGYPKTVTLKDGSALTLRLMTRDDEHDLSRFFGGLPEEFRHYLGSEVTDRKLIARWMRELDYERTLPLLAEEGGRIVATATLLRQTFGWGRKVGEVRVVIAPSFQGRGLGGLLLDEVGRIGADCGLRKLAARIVTGRPDIIRVLERAGFRTVAVLKEYFKDAAGAYADLAILVRELTCTPKAQA